MRGKTHRQRQHAPTDAPQQMILRALVGSLVVCATLGATNTPARTVSEYASVALVRASSVFQSQAHARHIVHVRAARVAVGRADRSDALTTQSLTHLIASSSGKQFSHAPGMSRERAGNLLPQNLALP
jgi:hypothetical protein